jgi:pantoate--beta-alanine ligase
MQVIDTITEWRQALLQCRTQCKSGGPIGLVPTMGALHAGHASLIDAAAKDGNEAVAVTIFVNPLQFGHNEDLSRYPRTLDDDLALAEAHGATHVFTPSQDEMYPRPALTTVTVRDLTVDWEGPTRPGHFDGVATVVAKLFNQAGPCRAYFGEKDYQQLCVIRRMAADLEFPVDVIGCPTVREPDGLALSSRNRFLDAEQRTRAATIYKALQAGAAAFERGDDPVPCMTPDAELIYAAAVDPDTLQPYTSQSTIRLLIAARLGPTRLIDNLEVTR